jgi:mRNA interferase RelE/StbE
MYSVVLSREARRFYEQCDRPVSRKLARCFQSLESDPREGNNVKPLKGQVRRLLPLSRWRPTEVCASRNHKLVRRCPAGTMLNFATFAGVNDGAVSLVREELFQWRSGNMRVWRSIALRATKEI